MVATSLQSLTLPQVSTSPSSRRSRCARGKLYRGRVYSPVVEGAKRVTALGERYLSQEKEAVTARYSTPPPQRGGSGIVGAGTGVTAGACSIPRYIDTVQTHQYGGTEHTSMQNALLIGRAFPIISSFDTYYSADNAYQEAVRVDDECGQRFTNMNKKRAYLQFCSGAASVPGRITNAASIHSSFASFMTHISLTSSLIASISFAGASIVRAKLNIDFRRAFPSDQSLRDQVAFIRDRVRLTEDDYTSAFVKASIDPDGVCFEEEELAATLTPDEREKIKRLYRAHRSYSHQRVETEAAKIKRRKKADFIRSVGEKSYERVVAHLEEFPQEIDFSKESEEVTTKMECLVSSVRQENMQALLINIGLSIASTLSATAMALFILMKFATVDAWIWVFTGLLMLCFDVYFFVSTYLEGKSTPKERIYVFLIKLLGVGIAVLACLSLAPYFVAIVLALQGGALLLFMALLVTKHVRKDAPLVKDPLGNCSTVLAPL